MSSLTAERGEKFGQEDLENRETNIKRKGADSKEHLGVFCTSLVEVFDQCRRLQTFFLQHLWLSFSNVILQVSTNFQDRTYNLQIKIANLIIS